MNADKYGTIDSLCYWPKAGCLNPAAVNFGCAYQSSKENCNDMVSVHTARLCVFPQEDNTSPPTPPPPAFPGGMDASDPNLKVEYSSTVESIIDGDVSYWQANNGTLIQVFKKAFSVPDSMRSEAILTPGSTNAKVRFWSNDPATASQLTSDIATKATSAAALSTLLNDAATDLGVSVRINVLTKPVVFSEVQVTVLSTPLSVGAIIGIVIGVLAGVIIIVAAIVYYRKKKAASKATYPA